MNKKTLTKTAITVFLLLNISLIVLVNPASCDTEARQTILIQQDGTVSPSNAPIQRNGDLYFLTADTYDPILIEKSGVTFDGKGYSLIGPLNETERKAEQIIGLGPNEEKQVPYIIGIDIDDSVSNVTIQNLVIRNFSIGAYIRSTNNTLTQNSVSENIVGVLLSGSANTIYKNYIAQNEQGLFFGFEAVNGTGNIPSDVKISHNSFVNNTRQLSGCVCKEYNLSETRHSWDDGKEGNYWSDYNGTDTNGDGIGDTPYIVDILNQDRYPLLQMPIQTEPEPAPIPTATIMLIAAISTIIIVAVAGSIYIIKRKSKPC
jgi:parallel beta-helix repeat protein